MVSLFRTPDYGWSKIESKVLKGRIRIGKLWWMSHDWFIGWGSDYVWMLNPVARMDIVDDDRYDDIIWRRTTGIDFRATWHDRVGVFFRFHDTKEWGNGPYRDRNQVYDDRYGYVGPLMGDDFTYYDVTEYGMHFRWGWFRLDGGKWQNQWGPGSYGHFLLSDEGTSYDQVRLKVDIGSKVRLTALTGVLKQYPSLGDTLYIAAHGEPRIVEPKKFVSAHRLDIAPHRKLQLGFSEMVIYGDRGLELGYLIPLNFYFSAEHHYGDQDNVVWAMDWKYTGIRGVRWYGELFIDDLTIAKLGENSVGNKWVAMTGVRWYDPFELPNVSMGIEFTAIRPFVFSHWYSVNTPAHWTQPLGHWAPPNSLIWTVGGDYQPIRSLYLSVRYDYQKHGANTDELNVGGDQFRPHGTGDSETVGFLDGDLQKQQDFSWKVSWEPLPRFNFAMEGGTVSVDVEDYSWMIAGLYLNFR